jgi:hypothetical protein
MLRISERERVWIGREIDALADEIREVGSLAGANQVRNEKLRLLQNKLDLLRDQLFYVRGRT